MKIYKKNEVRDIILAFLALSAFLAVNFILKNRQSEADSSNQADINKAVLCHQKETGLQSR